MLVVSPEVQKASLMPSLKGLYVVSVFVWSCSRDCVEITKQQLFLCFVSLIIESSLSWLITYFRKANLKPSFHHNFIFRK